MSSPAQPPSAPEVRFTAGALRAGLSPADVAAILGGDRATVEKHVRSAVRAAGGSPPPPGTDDAGLLAALGSDEAAGLPPSTACPDDEVIETLAHGLLDGPLLLAAAEHAADCPDCMGRVVAARKRGPPAPRTPVDATHGTRLALVVLLVALLVAAALFLL